MRIEPIQTGTVAAIRELADERSLVYLPSHDPASGKRLNGRIPVQAEAQPSPSAV